MDPIKSKLRRLVFGSCNQCGPDAISAQIFWHKQCRQPGAGVEVGSRRGRSERYRSNRCRGSVHRHQALRQGVRCFQAGLQVLSRVARAAWSIPVRPTSLIPVGNLIMRLRKVRQMQNSGERGCRQRSGLVGKLVDLFLHFLKLTLHIIEIRRFCFLGFGSTGSCLRFR